MFVEFAAHEQRRNTYPLVICYIAIEHGHINSEFSHEKWWFSIGLCICLPGRVASGVIKFAAGRSTMILQTQWWHPNCMVPMTYVEHVEIFHMGTMENHNYEQVWLVVSNIIFPESVWAQGSSNSGGL